MGWKKIRFDLEINLQTAWHVGTGLSRGMIHRTVQRNAYGDVYIPGSTIKGRLRNACESLAQYYCQQDPLLRTCQPPSPQFMCRGKEQCIICRIFGSVYNGDRLSIDDGLLQDDLRRQYDSAVQTQVRTRTKIDPQRGLVEARHLFSSEYAEKELTFTSQVNGYLDLTPLLDDDLLAHELILLAAGVRMVSELGGNKSAGFGKCEMRIVGPLEISAPQSEPALVDPAVIIEEWLKWLTDYQPEGVGV